MTNILYSECYSGHIVLVFRRYYLLTKPGIIRGNLITAMAGFLFASAGDVDWRLLLATLVGVSLVIASGCVFNNYLDREIDAKMARTKKRALVTGDISLQSALIYGSLLGILGFLTLAVWVNWLTVMVGLIGFIDYVILYGISKRRSVYGTLVGSISGAMPIVAGYTAASGQFDGVAFLLFLILTFWQMPHFYAIAIYRLKDYKAAKIPVLSAVRGIELTKLHIIFYIMAFIGAAVALTAFDYTGLIYLFVMAIAGGFWLNLALSGLKTEDNDKWAHKIFGVSLLVLLTFSVMISVDSFVI